MESATASVPATHSPTSATSRILTVLFSPQKTFEDIVRKPGWLPPVVLLTLLSLLVGFAINQRVDWRAVVSQQMEALPMTAQLSPEQKEPRIAAGAKIAPVTSLIGAAVGTVLSTLFIALAMWAAYTFFAGANMNLNIALAITSHSLLTGLISSPLLIVVLYLRPIGTVDLQNPMASNLAAFLPEHSAGWLFVLCKSVDIFSLWTLILLAIGFAATGRISRSGGYAKRTDGKSYAIAFGVWAVYVAARVGLVLIFS